MKRKTLYPAWIVASALLLIFQGSPSLAQEKELLIGDINPLTGPGAYWGIGSVRALELNAEKINKAGGLVVQGQRYKLKYINEDDKYTGAGGVAAVNKLIFTNKIKYIVGPLSSASILAMQPITESNKVILICDSHAPPELLKGKKYTFRVFSPPTHLAPAFFTWFKQTYPNVKTVAHISPNDATGWGSSQGDNDAAEHLGIKVVADEWYERGTTDFRAMLTRILAKNPGFFAMGGTAPGDAALIIKQARELGFKGMITHTGMLAPFEIGPVAGWENVEGVISVAIGAPSPRMPQPMQEFIRDYKAKYGDLNGFAPHMYDMLTVFALGVKKANSLDPDDIARAIENLGEFDSIFGKAKMGGEKLYGRKAQIIRNCLFSQIQDRELVVVGSSMAWDEPPPQKKWR